MKRKKKVEEAACVFCLFQQKWKKQNIVIDPITRVFCLKQFAAGVPPESSEVRLKISLKFL